MLQEVISQVNAMVDTARNNTFRYSSKHPYCVRRYTFGMLKTTTMCHIPDFIFDPREARMISNAAYLHDVGKLLTPKSLLNKRGPLTPEEREKMQLHTMDGAMLIYFHPAYEEPLLRKYAFEIALHHHERIDGKGYPDGLQGSELAPWLQIVSIADTFSALMEKRPYRPAVYIDRAWEMILNGDCGQFDDRLLRCLDDDRRWVFGGVSDEIINAAELIWAYENKTEAEKRAPTDDWPL